MLVERGVPARVCAFVEITGIADMTCFLDGYEHIMKIFEFHVDAGTMCCDLGAPPKNKARRRLNFQRSGS